MAKKRVYELAKELNLESKELLSRLNEWGYEVKSASSTLEDDQARTVLDRYQAERAPAPAAKPTGVVIRRSRARTEAVAPVVRPAAQPTEPERVEEPEEEPEAPVAPAAAAEAPAAAAAEPAPVEAPAEQAPPAPAVEKVAAAAEAKPVAAARPTADKAVVVSRPPPPGVMVRPKAEVAANAAAAEAAKARVHPGTDRPLADDEEIRVVGGVPHVVKKSGAEQGRPTANRAVLVSRPVYIEKKFTPAPGKEQYPMAPGIKPGSLTRDVREVQVINEGGRARDLVDLKKKGGRPSGVRNEKVQALSKQDLLDLVRARTYVPVVGRKKRPTKKGKKTEITEMAAHKKVITMEETITVRELSERMGVKGIDLVKKMMAQPIRGRKMVNLNQTVDFETASLIASDYGWELRQRGFEVSDYLPAFEDNAEDHQPRPPVVTVMGHVDHGKTSLLDALRQANVAGGEAGGITQHIGAYSVTLPGKGDVTFLDTPGHEAFSSMRARGAQLTDIVILVVASDDGVQPQTLESIKHAKEAEVPVVVAINKIDKPGVNPDAIKSELASHGLTPEEWGGDTPMIPVSALQKTNLELLLENVLLQAEVLELDHNPKKLASGTVVESRLERGRGPVATVLVTDGVLKVGDALVAGQHWGRVRAMTDDKGRTVKEVHAGYPVQVVGLSGTPDAGDEVNVLPDEKSAQTVAEHRIKKGREAELVQSAKLTVEDLVKKVSAEAPKELVVIVKADVQGSAEAVTESLRKLSGKKVTVNVIARGVGGVTESDVNQAKASKALIVGFNVKPDPKAAIVASQHDITVKTYSIIYDLLDDVRTRMEDLLEPIYREKPMGKAEVRAVFNVSRAGTIAGCMVVDGKVTRGAQGRVVRERKVLHTGKLGSLKRFKDDVREVPTGQECGIGFEGFNDLQVGDVLEIFEIETLRQKLD